MRDQLKVIIGFGSIWGLFAFGSILLSSFALGVNDTAPERLALMLYALTILPACILAIWYRRASGFWLVALAILTLCGFTYQVVVQASEVTPYKVSLGDVASTVFFSSIPALLGVSLLRTSPLEEHGGQLG